MTVRNSKKPIIFKECTVEIIEQHFTNNRLDRRYNIKQRVRNKSEKTLHPKLKKGLKK